MRSSITIRRLCTAALAIALAACAAPEAPSVAETEATPASDHAEVHWGY